MINQSGSTEVQVFLSWTAVYLIIFIGVFFIQSGIVWASKRARKHKITPSIAKDILNPRTTKSKIPTFILLFAVTGFMEAYLKYKEGFDAEALFSFGAISVFFIYLIMLATLPKEKFRDIFLILMGGLLSVFLTHYITSILILEGLI